MHRTLAFIVTLVLALAAAQSAWAQTTGSISGTVYDKNGAPVEGATVQVSGDQLPAGRSVATGKDGAYRLPLLLPGTYTVEVTKQGLGTSKREVIVQVDKDVQLELVVGLAVQEEITVAAASPLVDVKSTEVSFNYKQEFLESVPLERTYRGLFQLIPGVADNRSAVGPSAGGTRQDNTYLIDGVNITNPLFGYLSTEVNELDIAEVNMKRAGVSAEFGRTSGTVTNVISKSGTNRLSGTARIDWLSKDLITKFDNSAFRDSLLTTTASPAIGVGGPFIKDQLFWYGSARYFRDTKWERINKLNSALPDEIRTGHELYGKVTATPGPRHLVNVGYRDRPNHVKNASLGASSEASVATTTDNSSRVANASWAYFATNHSLIDVKYVYMKEQNEDVPITSLGYLPTWDPVNLARMGLYSDPLKANVATGGAEFANKQNYRRHEIKATYNQFFDLGGSNHDFKVGAGYEFGEESLNRLANGWGSLAQITVSGQPVIRARYYFQQPPQIGQGRTWSIFAQDNITLGSRATINAGVLANRDNFAQDLPGSGGCPTVSLTGGAALFKSTGDRCTFMQFGFGDEIQPRLGVNYSVRKGTGDKAYANWGRYYGLDQKSTSRSFAPRRIFQREARFNASTGALISDLPRASTTGKLIDPDLKPIYNDEILVGYATPVSSEWSVDVFFMYRKTNHFFEDVPSALPDTGPYVAENLPCTRFASCQQANAKRSYKAFTVDVARRLTKGWTADVSYTWSRFEGNFDLDYSGGAVFNTSSFIQDGPGDFVEEPLRFGPLRQDRPSIFKVFTSWVPREAISLGAYFRVQSGTPWSAVARDWEGGVLHVLEQVGSHRNPTWANLDLLASYRVRMSSRAWVSFEARVLNVFGNQTRISTDAQQFLDLPTIPNPPYFGTYTQPNPFFQSGNAFAPPRRLVLAATAAF